MTQKTLIARRHLLLTGAALVGLAACDRGSAVAATATEAAFADSPFRKISDAEWRRRLPAKAYSVLRHEDTEMAGTGPFLNEKRKGVYQCLGCELPLFQSEWKFESGTGWPSFFRAIDANIGKKVDRTIGMERIEYHCARCLGHHGHLFDDGPRPTGLRYCNNGLALKFVPA